MAEKKKDSLMYQLGQALGHISPSLLGRMIGGSEGVEGRVAGYEAGSAAKKGLDQLSLQNKNLALKQQGQAFNQQLQLQKMGSSDVNRVLQQQKFQLSTAKFLKEIEKDKINEDKYGGLTQYQFLSMEQRKIEETGKNVRAGIREKQWEYKRGDTEHKKMFGLIKTFNSDSVVAPIRGSLNAAEDVIAIMATNSPLTDAVVRRKLANLAGEVGRLTEQDVAVFGGSPAYMVKLKNAVSLAANGQMTQENKTIIMEFAIAMAKHKAEQMHSWADKFANQFDKATGSLYGFDYFRDLLHSRTPDSVMKIRNERDAENKQKKLFKGLDKNKRKALYDQLTNQGQ